MNGRGMRVARGLAAAAVATFVAAFSHAAAGGGAPGGVGLVLAAAFSAMVCVLLTSRTLSLPLLAISVTVSQFAFHLLFGVGGGTAAAFPGGGAIGHTDHHAGGSVAASGAGAVAASGPDIAASTHLHESGWMWVAHLAAAVATIALLHRGERMLRRLLVLAGNPLRCGLHAAHLRMAAAAALLAPSAPHAAVLRQRDIVRRALEAARSRAVDRLAECGVVFTRLRHRGPPVVLAARFSV